MVGVGLCAGRGHTRCLLVGTWTHRWTVTWSTSIPRSPSSSSTSGYDGVIRRATSPRCAPMQQRRTDCHTGSHSTAEAGELASKLSDALGTRLRRTARAGDRIDPAQTALRLSPTVATRLAQPMHDLTIGDPGKRRGPALRADSGIHTAGHRSRVGEDFHDNPLSRRCHRAPPQPRDSRGRSHIP